MDVKEEDYQIPVGFDTHIPGCEEAIFKQLETGHKSLKYMADLLQKIADIEREASTKVIKLLKDAEIKAASRPDGIKSMDDSFQQIRSTLMTEQNARVVYASTLVSGVVEPWRRQVEIGVAERKAMVSADTKTTKDMQRRVNAVDAMYRKCQRDLQSALHAQKAEATQAATPVATGFAGMLSKGKNTLKKNMEKKLGLSEDAWRQHATDHSLQYQTLIAETNAAAQSFYDDVLPSNLRKMQKLEAKRLTFARRGIYNFIQCTADRHAKVAPTSGFLKSFLAATGTEKDLRMFILNLATFKTVPEYVVAAWLSLQPITFEVTGIPAVTIAALPATKFNIDRIMTVLKGDLFEENDGLHILTEAGWKVARSLQIILPTPLPPAYELTARLPLTYELSVQPAEIRQGKFEGNPNSVFGKTVSFLMERQKTKNIKDPIPRVLIRMVNRLIQLGGLDAEGVFRKSASQDEMMATIKSFEDNDEFKVSSTDPYLPAAIMKQFMRNLAEPLVPNDVYPKVIALADKRPKPTPQQCRALLQKELPAVNMLILDYMGNLGAEISSRPTTLMTPKNLAIVFGPCFLRNPSEVPEELLMSAKVENEFVAALMESYPVTLSDPALEISTDAVVVMVDQKRAPPQPPSSIKRSAPPARPAPPQAVDIDADSTGPPPPPPKRETTGPPPLPNLK